MKKILTSAVIVILIISNVFFIIKFLNSQKELRGAKMSVANVEEGEGKFLAFGQLFIKDVLEAENEIDFETRLKLENAVRDLNDEELLNQWKLFVASQDEASAQKEIRNLLKILMNKIGMEK